MRLAIAAASRPLADHSTEKPSYCRLSRSIRAIALSSSISRMRFPVMTLLRQRDQDAHLGSSPQRTSKPQPAAVMRHDAFGNRQSQAASRGQRVPPAEKSFADVRHVVGMNADPVIGHREVSELAV